jgi:drug/metabolite transporter (DMT)-like permease
MNKLFDLRFVIGAFFTVCGLMLLVYSFGAEGAPVNRWCGIVFMIFGLLMIALSYSSPVDEGDGAH